MSLVSEAIHNEIEDFEEEILEEAAAEEIGAGPSARIGDFLPDFSFLLSPTGPGPVESYIDHPFNTSGSEGTARILRGLTGIMGDLNYAVVDIVLGSVEVYQEKGKKVVKNEPANIPD